MVDQVKATLEHIKEQHVSAPERYMDNLIGVIEGLVERVESLESQYRKVKEVKEKPSNE